MRRPVAYTRLNSPGFRRRRAGGKHNGGAEEERARAAIIHPRLRLRAQALAALRAAAGQDGTSVLRGHAGTKSMGACTAHLARLISTFHDFKALKTERKMARQGTQRGSACQYNRFLPFAGSV
jgi:hypothetical protein